MDNAHTFHREILPHRATLDRLARRFGVDGDDLVQETYVRALQAQHSYRPGSNARGWLCRILVNTALTEHRRHKRELRMRLRVGAEPLEPVEPVAPPALRGPDVDVAGALETLPASERRVLELADVEGLRYREIAAALGCPIGTVMSRLFRARRHLRQRVELARAA